MAAHSCDHKSVPSPGFKASSPSESKTGETDYYTHKHSKQIGLKKRRIYAQFRQHRIFTEPNDL